MFLTNIGDDLVGFRDLTEFKRNEGGFKVLLTKKID